MKILLTIFPYLTSLLFALLFFAIGINQKNPSLNSMFLGLSGTLLGIPVVFLAFNVAKSVSERKLSENVFEYIKMQADTLLLGLMNRIIKLIYPYEYPQTSPKAISSTLSLTKENLSNSLKNNKHIGFAFLCDLKGFEEKFRSHLNFALSISYLNVDILNTLIEIGKSIRSFIYYSENTENLFLIRNGKADYIIKSASELNKTNPDNAYLLMKTLSNNKSKVIDSGTFTRDKVESLLNYCDINPEHLPKYTNELFLLLRDIQKWLKITKYKFIFDTRQFKVTYAKNE